MENILLQSCILIVIMVLGYIVKKAGLFGKEDYRVITRLVMYFTLPCMIITNFSKFEWENALFFIPLLGIGINVLMQICAYFFCKDSSDDSKIFYMLNLPGFSMGTFALPFIQNLLGTEGVVAACMFDAGGTIMPSGTSYVCTSAILKERKQKEKVNAEFVIKRLFTSPPFLTYLVMIPLKACNIPLPSFIMSFTGKVSDANTFLCMIMIGMMFEIKFRKDQLENVVKLLASRLVFSTLAAIIMLSCDFGTESLRKALAIVMFSPIAALSLVFTDKVEGDTELAGFVNSLSVILSIIVMTGLVMLLI